MLMIDVCKGQAPGKLSRIEFGLRFQQHFADPAFKPEGAALERLETIAWQAFDEGRWAAVRATTAPALARSQSRIARRI